MAGYSLLGHLCGYVGTWLRGGHACQLDMWYNTSILLSYTVNPPILILYSHILNDIFQNLLLLLSESGSTSEADISYFSVPFV
jgi:hypothetical protein